MTAATASQFVPILEDYWRLNPVEATHAGVHHHDAWLPDLSTDGLALRREWRTQTATHLASLENLAPEHELDRRVLQGELAGAPDT